MGVSSSRPPGQHSGAGGSGVRPRLLSHHHPNQEGTAGTSGEQSSRSRSRSLDFLHHQPDDSDDSEGELESPSVSNSRGRRLLLGQFSIPPSYYRSDIKCPVCFKTVPHDDIEIHLVVCLTKPRINYNEDVLQEDKETECAICLEELVQGDTIARLPCLCIYHKNCIDDWFKRSRTCPEHPGD